MFTQRCRNSPRWETGLHSASDVTHRQRAEDLGRFWKSQLRTWHRTIRLTFAYSRRPLWRVLHMLGWGADEKARIERLCLSLPYVETFNSKVIKGFVPELRSRKVFFVFRDSYVLSLWTFMSISHIHIGLWYSKYIMYKMLKVVVYIIILSLLLSCSVLVYHEYLALICFNSYPDIQFPVSLL